MGNYHTKPKFKKNDEPILRKHLGRQTDRTETQTDRETWLYRAFLATTGDWNKRLYKQRASQISNIPIKIIKDTADLQITKVKQYIVLFKLPIFLFKVSWYYPLHTKGRKNNKENYRVISILPTLPKIFERVLFEQVSSFFDDFLSDQQCEFWKGHSKKNGLLSLLEKWKISFDMGESFYYQTSQRYLIASIMDYSLQNSIHMELVRLHYDSFKTTYQTEKKNRDCW